jgi:uncharacterized membrane protein YiaA
MPLRFTIRDLFWLVAVVALTVGFLNLTVVKPGEPLYAVAFCLWGPLFAIVTRSWMPSGR